MLNTDQAKNKKWAFKIVMAGIFVCRASTLSALDQPMMLARTELENVSIKEKQVVEINKNLKSVIEENQRLSDLTEKLQSEIESLKDVRTEDQSRYAQLKKERDQLASRVEQVSSSNRKYSQEIKQLENSLGDLQTANDENIQRAKILKTEIVSQAISDGTNGDDVMMLASADVEEASSSEEVQDMEDQTVDLLTSVDAFAETDEEIRMDAARAHYNMGNIYFKKGEYEIAAQEYYQAVTLMPEDPDSHYNLALVSGDFLNDHETAIKHYQQYLYLNPGAEDVALIKEKILHSDLILKSAVNSVLECGKDKKSPCH
jgi:tetratricopeptide (TPR) repeat protein